MCTSLSERKRNNLADGILQRVHLCALNKRSFWPCGAVVRVKTMNFFDIVKDKIEIDSETECWNWTKSTSQGYGQININKVKWNAHRLAYAMTKGTIPDNLLVRHKCNNRKCCNPDHVEVGTHFDNYHDSIETHRVRTDNQKFNWFIDGWVYDNIRDASMFTGISQMTIMRHSVNGVFDIEKYRESCRKGNVKPKL